MFNNIKELIYILREKKRYKKLKNCNIPYPFFDKKRNIFEWVQFSKENNSFITNGNIQDALNEMVTTGLIYHYKLNSYNYDKQKYTKDISHGHNFNDVISALYDYPESFEIPNEYINEYSDQELKYIKNLKEYFKLINLKDIKYNKEIEKLDNKWSKIYNKKHKSLKDYIFINHTYSKSWNKLNEIDKLNRYNNQKALEYSKYQTLYVNNNTSSAILNNKKDYIIFLKHSFTESRLNKKLLIVNDDYKYTGIIEIVSEKEIKFKDLKEDMVDYKLAGFKNFKEYKNSLYNDFKDECNAYDEEFNNESLIIYVKLEVVEKFN